MENWDYQDEYIWNLETGKNTFKKKYVLGSEVDDNWTIDYLHES